jgi:hypothetical protein
MLTQIEKTILTITTATTTTTSNTHKMSSATNTRTTSSDNLSGSTLPLQNTPTEFNLPMLNVLPTKLKNVDSLVQVPRQSPATMPDGYIPSDSDVCSGRGKQNWNMAGTVNFRRLIHAAVGRYMAATLRNHKTAVVVSVVAEIRRQGGHFFKERKHGNSGPWYEIGDTAACKKVGHSLRVQVNNCTPKAVKSRSVLQAKEETRRAADAVRDCDSAAARLTEISPLPLLSLQQVKEETRRASLPALSVLLVREETRRASLPLLSVQLVREETRRSADAARDYDSADSAGARLAETSPLPSLSVHLVKEETRRAADAARDCDSTMDSAETGLTETSSLPSLSRSNSLYSFSLFTEERTLDDFVPPTTLSRATLSDSFDISSVMWDTDLLPTNSSEHLLFDGCYL